MRVYKKDLLDARDMALKKIELNNNLIDTLTRIEKDIKDLQKENKVWKTVINLINNQLIG